MQTIFELKEQAVTDTPLLLFDCVLSDGTTEHWSTHAVSVGEVAYSARVLGHNVFELQASSDQGADGVPKISLVLANADSHCSAVSRVEGGRREAGRRVNSPRWNGPTSSESSLARWTGRRRNAKPG